MRRRTLLICLCLAGAIALAAGAQEKAPATEAGFFFNLFPMFEYTNRAVVSTGSDISDQAFGAYYETPTFGSGGFYLKKGPITAIGIMEFQQDIWSKQYKHSFINLPDSETGWTPDIIGLGTLYPNVGYVDYDADGIRLSLGRRKISDGPGTYGLGISAGNPFYDHVAASLAIPIGAGKLGYDYAAIGMQRWGWSSTNPKYYFFHRASWTGKRFTIGINEYSLVVDATPDFQDWGPFLFYHNLFNSNQNVMAGFDFAWTPADAFALYGQFILDDFMLSTEVGANPTAIGMTLGADLRLLPGSPARGAKFYDSDYTYRVGALKGAEGGLSLRAEGYLMSRYLYRRQDGKPNEAFTAQYEVMSNWSEGYVDARPFLATPLSPDTALARLALTWDDQPVKATFAFEYRLVGSESGTKTYNYSTVDYANWLWPSSPTTQLGFALDGKYRLGGSSMATAGVGLLLEDGGAEVTLNAGFAHQFAAGKGPSLK